MTTTETTAQSLWCSTGHRYTLICVSLAKRVLQLEMAEAERLELLQRLDKMVDQWLTAEAIAAVQPICNRGYKLIEEAEPLGNKALDVYARSDVFDAFTALNPSLLTAIEIANRTRLAR